MKASELYALAIEEYRQICILSSMTLRDYCKERHVCYGGIHNWMSRHSIKVADLKPRPVLPDTSASTPEQASCEGQQLYPLSFIKEASEKPVFTGNVFPVLKGVNITFPDGVIITIKEISQEDLNKFIQTYFNQ